MPVDCAIATVLNAIPESAKNNFIILVTPSPRPDERPHRRGNRARTQSPSLHLYNLMRIRLW